MEKTQPTTDVLEFLMRIQESIDNLSKRMERLEEGVQQAPVHACNGGTPNTGLTRADWRQALERLEEALDLKSKSTRDSYLRRVRNFLGFADYEPDEDTIRNFLLKLEPYRKWYQESHGRKLRPRKKSISFKVDGCALKKLLKQLKDKDTASYLKDYIDELVEDNTNGDDTEKHNILLDDEIRQFFAAARHLYENPNGGTKLSFRQYLALKTQFFTGLRISALLRLTPSMFVYLGDNPYLRLPRPLLKRQEHGADIPIEKELYDEIRTYAKEHGIKADERLFPFTSETLNEKIKVIAAEMGLNRKLTSHGMRGTAISQAYLRFGKDAVMARKFACHKRFEQTAYYIDLHPDSNPMGWWDGMNVPDSPLAR